MPYQHTEAQLETIFRLRVTQVLGGMVVKVAPTTRGVPDRLVLLPCNRVRLVELKTNSGKLSPIQRDWHARAAALGITVEVLHGITDIETWTRDRATEYDHLMEVL